MENKKGLSPVLLIVAIILGAALYKQFDFQHFKFEKPALAIVYLIVFVGCIFFLVKRPKKQ
ncbi:hypothetical protein HGH92_26805 [Chitinophaga varians]|uniref:ATP synthase F0 sector subunit C n=1 Tax=Chitinophaga varians TaxID=2202339 RepID=A0A847S0S8_9BACT|nr:hypothetical protein [Chitinophaga varians]NLR67944.1 hypothetical protein [Chitinophaga varians]